MTKGLWSRDTVGWLIAASLLPPAAVTLVTFGVAAALTLGAALLAALGWQLVFRQTLGVPFSPSGLVTALALTAMGPPDAALWQVALAASFGMVLADLVFGGWCRNVIPAPVTALAFAALAFPDLAPARPDVMIAFAAMISGAGLLLAGILETRTVLGFALGLFAVWSLAGAAPQLTGAVAFGLVFLAGDPASRPALRSGRWIHGSMAGALTALLAWAGPGADVANPTVFAALLAAIFAPLADHAALAAARIRRPGHHG